MFLGGVYMPRALLPEIVQRIGEFTPPGVPALPTRGWASPRSSRRSLAMAIGTVVVGVAGHPAVPVGMTSLRLAAWSSVPPCAPR